MSDNKKELLESLEYTANILSDLHGCWAPHEAQIPPGRALFYEGNQFIFLECGRKYGKTDFVIYCIFFAEGVFLARSIRSIKAFSMATGYCILDIEGFTVFIALRLLLLVPLAILLHLFLNRQRN